MLQQTKNIYHLYTSILANAWLRFPSRKLIMIGVTGTDGKTTTVNLIYHILKTAGLQASMVSTVGAILNNKVYDIGFHVTTPGAFELQSFIKQAAGAETKGKKYMVLEVSSHRLDQNGLWGIPFTIGVITNVTHEHIDYHKSYTKYLNAKVKLLFHAKTAIINHDDESYTLIKEKLQTKKFREKSNIKKLVTFGLHENADVNPQLFPIQTNLLGEHNTYNILAAVAAVMQLGISEDAIREAIKTFKPPIGRGEIVYDKGFRIMIDYAHTINGVRQVLSTLQKNKTGKIIALIGAEGYRDQIKRPIMAEIAVKLADYVIITAVDPRGLIDRINEEMLKGAIKAGGVLGKNVFIESDRQKAIEFAITHLAKKGDTIAVLGKGHEQSMNLDGKHEIPWSDYEAVKKVLSKITDER